MDCDSPFVPWDSIDAIPAKMKLGETFTVEIPLATNLESVLGVSVCG